jgi:hypothetical protein
MKNKHNWMNFAWIDIICTNIIVPFVEQELLTLPENPNSPPIIKGVVLLDL